MTLRTLRFSDTARDEWNGLVSSLGEATFYHSWDLLNFYTCMPGVVDHSSFILLQDERTPLAVCPLALTDIAEDGGKELSFGGRPLGTPAFAGLRPSARRRLMNEVFSIYAQYAAANGASKIKMFSSPLRLDYGKRRWSGHQNQFELQRYNFLYLVNNTLVVDLGLQADDLEGNLSKYQRRHVKRGLRAGLEVKAVNARTDGAEAIREQMRIFQEVHRAAAGRTTQSDEAWQALSDACVSGNGSLFANYLKDRPISYLYCCEFGTLAKGWSQANHPDYEEEYSPRHLLEWKAILHYKQQGFQFYEIGDRYFGAQLFHVPTEKEVSIAVFKERYGGFLLPNIHWVGYRDHALFEREVSQQLRSLIDALPPCLDGCGVEAESEQS